MRPWGGLSGEERHTNENDIFQSDIIMHTSSHLALNLEDTLPQICSY